MKPETIAGLCFVLFAGLLLVFLFRERRRRTSAGKHRAEIEMTIMNNHLLASRRRLRERLRERLRAELQARQERML